MSNFRDTRTNPDIALPHGWVLITEESLDSYREEELTLDEAVAYFDGLSPTWKEALSKKIPQRRIVWELQESLEEARRVKRRQVTLLLGAGGEGKSTVLRQVIGNLSALGSYQRILWHEDVNTPLERTFVKELIASRESWLIASDEADRISSDVYDAVSLLHEKAKNNIQFLLCCRDTDWNAEHANELSWNEHGYFVPRVIRGLTPEDANLIVAAWSNYEKRGLGKLAGLDLFEAASRLVEQAKSEAQNNSAEGSFLGAMLRVRIGEAIQDHVKSLLRRLDSRKVTGGDLTLMDAFAYIVALHAQNILLLSRSVLARALSCPSEHLHKRILGPLGEEAATSVYSTYVLTRHRAIAETAQDILSSVFNIDFAAIYSLLLRSAREAYLAGDLEVDVAYWNRLPNIFFNRGEKDLGIRLARVLADVEPDNPVHVVRLSKLYREANHPEQAVKVFRDSLRKVEPDRAYYHEWGFLENGRQNHYIAICLDAISLADGINEGTRDKNRMMRSLCGLAFSFSRSFRKTKDERFIQACSAAIQFGLQSSPDERTRETLFRYKKDCVQAGIDDVDNEKAFDWFLSGIHLAWELRDEDEDITVPIKPVKDLAFESMRNKFARK